MQVDLTLDGRSYHVQLERSDAGWEAVVDGERFAVAVDRSGPGAVVRAGGLAFVVQPGATDSVIVDGRTLPMRLEHLHGVAGLGESHGKAGAVKPPMTGRVDEVRVKAGQTVSRGDVLFVLEAMKMRNEVRSPADGLVSEVHVKAGANVDPKMTIVTLTAA